MEAIRYETRNIPMILREPRAKLTVAGIIYHASI